MSLSFLSTSVLPFESSFLVSLLPPLSEPPFESLKAAVGTFGVLTGNMGEFVRDRLPKNLDGFSGPLGVASNLALPLATAPVKVLELENIKNETLYTI